MQRPGHFISKIIESKPGWPAFDDATFRSGDGFDMTRVVSEWVNATIEYRLRRLNGGLDTPQAREAVLTVAYAVMGDLRKMTGICEAPVVSIDVITTPADVAPWRMSSTRYSVRWAFSPLPDWWTPVDTNELAPGGVDR